MKEGGGRRALHTRPRRRQAEQERKQAAPTNDPNITRPDFRKVADPQLVVMVIRPACTGSHAHNHTPTHAHTRSHTQTHANTRKHTHTRKSAMEGAGTHGIGAEPAILGTLAGQELQESDGHPPVQAAGVTLHAVQVRGATLLGVTHRLPRGGAHTVSYTRVNAEGIM